MRLEASSVSKWYFRSRADSNRFFAVQDACLLLEQGTVTVLTGRSGSGKTTLLNMLSGLLTPDEGKILADGQDLYSLSDEALSSFRNGKLGLIPQGAMLLPHLTVLENLLLPLGIYGIVPQEETRQRALEFLEELNLPGMASVPARELSGGERRRVCIARALLPGRKVLLADEPTSDLDDANLTIVLNLLKKAAQEGSAVLVVSHDQEALSIADRHLIMNSGRLSEAVDAF